MELNSPSFHIVKHIRLNIGPAVRQSVSHWNLQSFSELSPGSGLFLMVKKKSPFKATTQLDNSIPLHRKNGLI